MGAASVTFRIGLGLMALCAAALLLGMFIDSLVLGLLFMVGAALVVPLACILWLFALVASLTFDDDGLERWMLGAVIAFGGAAALILAWVASWHWVETDGLGRATLLVSLVFSLAAAGLGGFAWRTP